MRGQTKTKANFYRTCGTDEDFTNTMRTTQQSARCSVLHKKLYKTKIVRMRFPCKRLHVVVYM